MSILWWLKISNKNNIPFLLTVIFIVIISSATCVKCFEILQVNSRIQGGLKCHSFPKGLGLYWKSRKGFLFLFYFFVTFL